MSSLCGNCFQTIDSQICPHCGYDPNANREKYPLALPNGAVLGGRYIIGKVLGQGGFGITYKAQDYQTKEIVAVKEYFPDTMATRTQELTVTAYSGTRQENFFYGKQCFLDEATTLGRFNGNSNIVRIYSYFEENGTAYFVMEYVTGISFQDYIRQRGGRISWEDTKNIVFPVMEALEEVHRHGIIHRDVTPDNICISQDGMVKLLDFGAARVSLGDKSKSLDVVLKHGFAPKEQYIRRGRQGPYTDVYSLGASMYYAVTGRVPPESIERMDEDELIPPRSRGISIPPDEEDALLTALEVNAQDRYQTMGEFRRALLAASGFQGVPVYAPVARPQVMGQTPPAGQPYPASQQQPYAVSQQQPYAVSQQQPYAVSQQQPYAVSQQPYAVSQQQPYAVSQQQPYAVSQQPYAVSQQQPYAVSQQQPYAVSQQQPYAVSQQQPYATSQQPQADLNAEPTPTSQEIPVSQSVPQDTVDKPDPEQTAPDQAAAPEQSPPEAVHAEKVAEGKEKAAGALAALLENKKLLIIGVVAVLAVILGICALTMGSSKEKETPATEVPVTETATVPTTRPKAETTEGTTESTTEVTETTETTEATETTEETEPTESKPKPTKPKPKETDPPAPPPQTDPPATTAPPQTDPPAPPQTEPPAPPQTDPPAPPQTDPPAPPQTEAPATRPPAETVPPTTAPPTRPPAETVPPTTAAPPPEA